MAALGDIIDLKCAQVSVSRENNELIKKFSLIKIAISSPETGSQFIVKFFVAALRTVLFLTTERSYIFVHPHSCLERLSCTAVVFNTIHTMRQSLSLLAPFKILLLSLKVSDLIYDINSSTSHRMCSEENIYPSTVYQMVRESLYTCIDDVFTVYVYILSLNLLSFRTSFWPHLFKEDCFFNLTSNSRKLLSENDVDAILC